jgi:hypothetical protein
VSPSGIFTTGKHSIGEVNGIVWLARGIVPTSGLSAEFRFAARLDIFAFYSPILFPVFHVPTSDLYPFVIVCKECHQNIPAPVETMPGSWIIAECPLCGQQRRYLPTDIFQGRLSHELLAKPRRTGGEKSAR